jgi:ribose-phosphate pyrophosphokinase
LDGNATEHGQPVLVDDILSTGETMARAIQLLRKKFSEPAICIAVHAVFAAGAHDRLVKAGAKKIVTTNTIGHSTSAIDVLDALSAGVRMTARI